jgi:hypothetical protein
MPQFPILFARRELVEGNGFVAGVDVRGRALMTQESETEFWLEGVNPGGFAAQGSNSAEALSAFSEQFRSVLYDIAASCSSFEDFRREVVMFFEETSPTVLGEWEAAVAEVRAGRVAADWLPNKKAANASSLGITVDEITSPRADNYHVSQVAIAR